jgi:hypothetical protein
MIFRSGSMLRSTGCKASNMLAKRRRQHSYMPS